jgi:hypothetical protein
MTAPSGALSAGITSLERWSDFFEKKFDDEVCRQELRCKRGYSSFPDTRHILILFPWSCMNSNLRSAWASDARDFNVVNHITGSETKVSVT